jgi:hypothetical protein
MNYFSLRCPETDGTWQIPQLTSEVGIRRKTD